MARWAWVVIVVAFWALGAYLLTRGLRRLRESDRLVSRRLRELSDEGPRGRG